jgi:hypothetical protein
MPRIGVTGHIRLASTSIDIVYQAICEELRRYRPNTLHGVTCLAAGADQLFARAVLAAGGTFEAILVAADYRDVVVTADNRPEFDALVALANQVVRMPFATSGPDSYQAAGGEVVRRCDLLLAVWDGTEVGSRGETANVVALARASDIPVRIVWPAEAARL